jgi:hypothetical protein
MRAVRLAHARGALLMGWAARGDECFGFPGEPNDRVRSRLLRALNARGQEFPRATHVVEIIESSRR